MYTRSLVACGRIHNGERKFSKHEMSEIFINSRSHLRMFEQELDDSLDFVAKSRAEFWNF